MVKYKFGSIPDQSYVFQAKTNYYTKQHTHTHTHTHNTYITDTSTYSVAKAESTQLSTTLRTKKSTSINYEQHVVMPHHHTKHNELKV